MSSQTQSHKNLVFSMCNPLLDISAQVPIEMVKKYDGQFGNAIMATEKQMPVYQELVDKYKVNYILGGAGQNAMRVMSWMLQEKEVGVFCGCVGKDKFGEQMEKEAKEAGVNVQYMIDEKAPTGTCACLVVGTERSLIANLGAANNYKIDHLKTEKVQQLMKNAQYYYITGFFHTVSHDSILHVAQHAAENNKVFMANLSANFVPQFFLDRLLKTLPYVDYLFGNDDEAKALSKALGWKTEDVKEIAEKVSLMDKVNKKRDRVVIFTQGSNPVVVAINGKAKEYPVPPVPKEKLVDTNGAGDAFVGGFLSQLILGKSLDDCVKAGNYAAGVIIQHEGCTFPPKPDFK